MSISKTIRLWIEGPLNWGSSISNGGENEPVFKGDVNKWVKQSGT
jgi:hypothetical protein